MFVWPHGFFVDHEGNVWVTEGAPAGEARGAEGHKVGKGHQVFKFSPDGKVLMTLGVAGVHGDDQTHFNGPSHVLVAPNGEIWVTDGHRGGNNRVVKFTKDGKFIMQIGGGVKDRDAGTRSASTTRITRHGQSRVGFSSPIAATIAFRSSISKGKLISVWTQFGRPSAIAIDAQDRIYVVDGTSASPRPLAWVPRAAGPHRGMGTRTTPGTRAASESAILEPAGSRNSFPRALQLPTTGRPVGRVASTWNSSALIPRATSSRERLKASDSSSGCALGNERLTGDGFHGAQWLTTSRGEPARSPRRGLRLCEAAEEDTSNVLFAPPLVTIPVVGTGQRFAVRRIYCVGRNYAAHAREMGSDPTREPPFFFQKPRDAVQLAPRGRDGRPSVSRR